MESGFFARMGGREEEMVEEQKKERTGWNAGGGRKAGNG